MMDQKKSVASVPNPNTLLSSEHIYLLKENSDIYKRKRITIKGMGIIRVEKKFNKISNKNTEINYILMSYKVDFKIYLGKNTQKSKSTGTKLPVITVFLSISLFS